MHNGVVGRLQANCTDNTLDTQAAAVLEDQKGNRFLEQTEVVYKLSDYN